MAESLDSQGRMTGEQAKEGGDTGTLKMLVWPGCGPGPGSVGGEGVHEEGMWTWSSQWGSDSGQETPVHTHTYPAQAGCRDSQALSPDTLHLLHDHGALSPDSALPTRETPLTPGQFFHNWGLGASAERRPRVTAWGVAEHVNRAAQASLFISLRYLVSVAITQGHNYRCFPVT